MQRKKKKKAGCSENSGGEQSRKFSEVSWNSRSSEKLRISNEMTRSNANASFEMRWNEQSERLKADERLKEVENNFEMMKAANER